MKSKIIRSRRESFGAIISMENPQAIFYINHTYANILKLKLGPVYETAALLSSPIDVHLSITNKCSRNCPGCYKEKNNEEMDIVRAKEIIDKLSSMNVFTVAFGGGEPLLNGELFNIADYARRNKIIPNGRELLETDPKEFLSFGSIHLSLHFEHDLYLLQRSINHLKKASIIPGINILLTRENFSNLNDIISMLKKSGIDKVFLKFKLLTTNKEYENLKITAEDEIKFFPFVMDYYKKYSMTFMIDCSLFPAIAIHKPNRKILEFCDFPILMTLPDTLPI